MPTEQAWNSSDRPGAAPRHRRMPAARGALARCPRCGARIEPDVTWCGQCHTSLDPRSGDLSLSPEPGRPEDGRWEPGRPEDVASPHNRSLVGGRLPDEVLQGLMSRLVEESEPVLPPRALALTGGPWPFAVAAGGGLALALVLVGVPALLGRIL